MQITFADESGDTQQYILTRLAGFRISVEAEGEPGSFDAQLVGPSNTPPEGGGDYPQYDDIIVQPWDETTETLMDPVVVRASSIFVL